MAEKHRFTRARCWAGAMLLVLFCAPALYGTDARANDIDVAVDAKVYVGDKPRVRLKVHKDVTRARLEVRSDHGEVFRDERGPAAAGGELVYPLPHGKPGKLRWQGTLAVEFQDASSGSMPVAFDTEVVSAILFELLSTKAEVLEKNQVRVKMNQPAGKVSVEVLGDDGELLANTAKRFDAAPPGTELLVDWIPRTGTKPFRVAVVCYTPDDIFSPTLEFYPWSIEIPHEDVLFETGKSEIRLTETAKLEHALAELNATLKRYEKVLKLGQERIRFYVIGHTDTVGAAAANASLSSARASAIARWFLKHGVKIAIYARGVGEELLKEETADEVDNAANRRAEYLVSNDAPAGGLAGWQRVQ